MAGYTVRVGTAILASALAIAPAPAFAQDAEAKLLITLTWPDGHPDDIDLLVRDPHGEIAWYANPDVGTMYLARDDRGNIREADGAEGRSIRNPMNQETVIE